MITGACRTLTSQRTSPAMASIIRISDVDTYVITNVADVEQDGTVSEIGNIAVFGALEAAPPATTTAPQAPLTLQAYTSR